VVSVPMSVTSAPPMATPTTFPTMPFTTFWPVLSASERITDKVPRATQNEWATR
jgi:hypothetical protein